MPHASFFMLTGLLVTSTFGCGVDETEPTEHVRIEVAADQPFSHRFESYPQGEMPAAKANTPRGVTLALDQETDDFVLSGTLAPGEYVFDIDFAIIADGPTTDVFWEVTLVAF